MPPLGHKNIRWLDIAMNDPLAVRRFQRIRNFHADVQQQLQIHRTPRNPMLQRGPIEEFHRQVGLPAVFANFVNRADIRMVQRRRRSRLTPESLERLRIRRQFIRKEFQRHMPAKIRILSLVHHTHPAAAKLLDHAVMRDGTANRRLRLRHAGRPS